MQAGALGWPHLRCPRRPCAASGLRTSGNHGEGGQDHTTDRED